MSLPVFSLFPYGKSGDNASVEKAKQIVYNVKNSRVGFLNTYFETIMNDADKQKLSAFIPKESVLVPIPRSAPLLENAQWPGREICEVLIKNGFGESFIPMLKRANVVLKAAFQHGSGERPTVETHRNSIVLENFPIFQANVKQFILVDDVVTQGRTAYACYLKINEQFPNIPLSLFALTRTDTFKAITDWNKPEQSEIIYYPSGKTYHNLAKANPTIGLWNQSSNH